jgi:hypothetical protein
MDFFVVDFSVVALETRFSLIRRREQRGDYRRQYSGQEGGPDTKNVSVRIS